MIIEAPPRPDSVACEGKCGTMLEPTFIKAFLRPDGTPTPFSNKWIFEQTLCESCSQKSKEKKRVSERSFELKRMILDKGVQEFTFDRFTSTTGNLEALGACRKFDPTKENLYIWGVSGVGKSHVSCGVLREYFLGGLDCLFIKHAKLNRSMQGLKSHDYEAKLDYYVHLPFLLIDDLGTGKQTEFSDQVLYEIIDGRIMSYQTGMIITSNHSLSELASRYKDDRLPSRIAGDFRVIKMDGEDWRLKRGAR